MTRADQILATFSMTAGLGAYTGSFTPVESYRSPSVIGDGATSKFTVAAVSSASNLARTGDWEEFEGVYSTAGNGSITRTRLIASSTGSFINWPNPTVCTIDGSVYAEDLTISTTTPTNLTGYLKGDGSAVSASATVPVADVNGLGGAALLNVGTAADTVCAGDDSRLSNSRTPTGLAGGDLTGTYPNPTLVATAVTPGVYTFASLIVDSKGRITAAANGSTPLLAASNLSDLVNAATARTNLGLAAVASSGSAADLSAGTLPAGRMPALTGDVTTTAGAVATTIGAGKVTNAMLAGSIDLTAKVTGVLPVANGGTGSSTALAASNGEAIKSATQNLTGTAYQDVTDLSVTLPAVGTYLVSVSIYGSVLGSGGYPRMTCNLNLNGSDITDSEFAVVQGIGSTSQTATGTRTYVVTAAGAHTLKVQAKRTMSGGAWTTSSITSNSDGKSALMWIRLA